MNYNNPASRLYFFLEQGMQKNRGQSCRVVLEELMSINDYVVLLRGIAETRALVDESINTSKRLFPSARITQHWVTSVTNAFDNLHMVGQWAGFVDHIDIHTMEYLHHLSNLLDTRLPHSNMTLEGVAAYRAELNDLLEELLQADEPQELKEYLAEALADIISTLDQYAITGDKGVLVAVQKAVGVALSNPEIRQEMKSSSKLTKKAVAVLSKGAQAFTTAKALGEALEYFGDFFK